MKSSTNTQEQFPPTLPGHYYCDPAIYALEEERIFTRMWLCVGHTSSLPTAGMYRLVTIAGENILVLRDQQGKLRAFYNVCRHRGARVCWQESGCLKGSLQCSYHGWTYGLDGSLIGAPNIMQHEEFDPAAFGLVPVALEECWGLIWLHLSSTPPPLSTQLTDPLSCAGSQHVPRHLEGLEVGKAVSYEVQANWKIVVENGLECYHCPTVHPEFCDLFPATRSYPILAENATPLTLAEDAEAFTLTGKASRPPLSTLQPEEIRQIHSIVVFPNTTITLLRDHVQVLIFHPRSANTTSIASFWLFEPESIAAPDFDPMDTVALANIIAQEDIEQCNQVQQGVMSRAYASGGVYVPVEQHIALFRDFVLRQLAQ